MMHTYKQERYVIKPALTTRQVIIRIAAIIAIAEFVAMMLLDMFPLQLGHYAEAVLDVLILSVISIPLIYILVIKPFVYAKDEALEQINHLAHTDPLTQLSNRRHLLQHLHRTISSCRRHKFYGALLLIDLDGFKTINDVHGHDAGDEVLIQIAKRFRASIRSEELVCRLGGDEFIILVDYLDTHEGKARERALKIADKLIALANQPCTYHDNLLEVSASIGINLIRFEHTDPDIVIRQADAALYRSKQNGKGRATFSD